MATLKSKDLELDSTKRAKYGEGVAPKEAKLSSVKKVLMLALVPDCQENYHNVKALLQKLDFTGLDVSFSVDLKLALYLVGKQSGGCKHNCIYCTGTDPWSSEADFNNCVHENLLQPPFSDSTLILDCLNIPELHIHLGVTTKLLTYIVKCFGSTEDDKAKGRQFYDQFLKSISVTTKQYGRLEGNQCKKVLENTEKLLRMAKNLPSEVAVKVMEVVPVLQAFSDVEKACFGERLCGDYGEAIDKFSRLYRALPGITIPPKVHCLEVCHTINSIN